MNRFYPLALYRREKDHSKERKPPSFLACAHRPFASTPERERERCGWKKRKKRIELKLRKRDKKSIMKKKNSKCYVHRIM